MKLPNSDMDYMMEDLSMEKGGTTNPSDSADLSRSNNQNSFLQLTPSTASSQLTTAQRSRRNTVSIACERCRKRKTKCSGLPGPCTNCARLNVPCHEPGRRRSTVQSALEDRIQRLRSLAAANQLGLQDHISQFSENRNLFRHPSAESRQTSNTTAMAGLSVSGGHDFRMPSPASAYSSEGWAAGDPAPYFDNQLLQDTPDWTMSDMSDENVPAASVRPRPSFVSTMHESFAQSQNTALLPYDASRSSEGLNVCTREAGPSNGYHVESPIAKREQTPIGFAISYDSTFFDEEESRPNDSDQPTPSSMEPELQPSEDMEHNERLQSTGHSSAGSKQSLKPSPTMPVGGLAVAPDFTPDQGASLGYQLTRSQTVPTAYSQESDPTHREETGLINLIIRSSETQKYIWVYFSSIHNDYPFLDRRAFGDKRSLVDRFRNSNHSVVQQQTILQFQALLVAAIGTLVQHESTNMSSQYVKQATSIQTQFDMWNSVGGIHCAMLLALYCYLAQIRVYDTRQDESAEAQQSSSVPRQTQYPVNNLWLHNCQIAAACIDLGMHQPLAMQEQIRSKVDVKMYLEVCRNTIRSAYVLDRKISELRNRPRAFHDGDIDQTLLVDL